MIPREVSIRCVERDGKLVPSVVSVPQKDEDGNYESVGQEQEEDGE